LSWPFSSREIRTLFTVPTISVYLLLGVFSNHDEKLNLFKGNPMRYYLAVICTLSVALTACGGDGGGAGSSATLAPFIKFSSIVRPGTYQINGSSQQVDYTYNTGTATVSSISAATPFSSGASFVGTENADGLLTKAVLTSATGTNITVDTARGDLIGYLTAFPSINIGATANGRDSMLFVNPNANGWDYQSFGVWTTGAGTGSGTAGVVSLGAETAGSAIPVSGTATFTGISGGQYVDSTGTSTFVGSNMTATTNFGTRSIAFATTDTLTSTNLQTSTSNANLNTSGTLSYSAGVNQFTGAVSSVGGGASNVAMTGTATGKFYGPTAQEIGGTFAVSGGGAGYLGAFGGKR
jgi:hypothetical protein